MPFFSLVTFITTIITIKTGVTLLKNLRVDKVSVTLVRPQMAITLELKLVYQILSGE